MCTNSHLHLLGFYTSVFVLKKVVKDVIHLDYVGSFLEKKVVCLSYDHVICGCTYMLLPYMYYILPQECGCNHFMYLKLSS
jgi:hypothetical protein